MIYTNRTWSCIVKYEIIALYRIMLTRIHELPKLTNTYLSRFNFILTEKRRRVTRFGTKGGAAVRFILEKFINTSKISGLMMQDSKMTKGKSDTGNRTSFLD